MLARKVLLERALPLSVLGLALISAPVLILSPTGFSRLEALRQERARAEQEVAQLSSDVDELRDEVERIKSDPAAVERVARDELGLIRQTEVVFQFRE